MDTVVKLQDVALQMHLELAEEVDRQLRSPRVAPAPRVPGRGAGGEVAPCGLPAGKEARQRSLGVFPAVAPGGKTIPLLKTMLTTACERDCHYCPFRAGRNYRRHTFKPEEMARTFDQMHRAGLVQGLFLSSGIIGGGVRTQDRLLETIAILRRDYQFRGYVHLKIMPGAEEAQVLEAMTLADRLSINLEAPTGARLAPLAPMKDLVEELLAPFRWIEAVRRAHPRPAARPRGAAYRPVRWPSTTTQFVVGAVGDTDLELLTATDYLYRQLRLQRAYYSAFRPVPDTPLENAPPTPPLRQHRLYQASFLLRDYGFDFEDLPFGADGNLPLAADPKQAWAREHLYHEPVELNRADRPALLKVPGIGPRGADTILAARRQAVIRELRDLQQLGLRTRRLAPFVLLAGRRPTFQPPLL